MWLFLVPAAVPYLLAVIWPSLQGAFYSFTDWDGLNPSWSFVGLDNYERMFRDPQALRAVTNTVTLAVVITVVENIIGLGLALAVNARLKSRHVLRLLFFIPVVVISVVVAFLWQFIYATNGPLNELLRAFGMEGPSPNWLGSPSLALWSIAFVVIWQFSGYAMVIYLAGLQSVPEELLEAAALDGAGPFNRFWHVVRPMLTAAFTVSIMLSLIRGLMIFDQIWVMTQGGPAGSTNSLSTLVYRNAFQYGEFGYSTALAVTLAVLVAFVGIAQYRLVMRGRAGGSVTR